MHVTQAIRTDQQPQRIERVVNRTPRKVVVFFAGGGRGSRRLVLPASNLSDSLAANLDRLNADFYYED